MSDDLTAQVRAALHAVVPYELTRREIIDDVAARVAAMMEAVGRADPREKPDDPLGYRSCGLRALGVSDE